jgi:hypothetical protein
MGSVGKTCVTGVMEIMGDIGIPAQISPGCVEILSFPHP